MKANLKGMQGLKGLLLKHCEKIGIAVVAVVAVLMVVRSMSLERLPEQHQPQQLDELVSRSRQRVQEFSWSDAPPEERKEVVPLSNQGQRSVQPANYETSRYVFDAPVVPPTVLRTDPQLLPPQDLEVNVGTGLLAKVDAEVRRLRQLELAREQEERQQEQQRLRDQEAQEAERGGQRSGRRQGRGSRGGRDRGREGDLYGRGEPVDPEHPNRRPVVGGIRAAGVMTQGDERVERAHWAVVVAKVPIEDQLKRFREALEDARNYRPGLDCPQYIGYRIERAEVVSGKELDWKSLFSGHATTINAAITDWPESQPEVVHQNYVNPLLTFPLPPLVGRDWQYNATHSEIPLAVDVVDEIEPLEAEEDQPILDESDPEFFTQGQDFAAQGRYGLEGRGRLGGGRGRDMYRGMDMEFGGGVRGREYGSEYVGRGEMDYAGRGGGSRSAVQASMAICASDVPHILFRYFDLTVQPGRRYRYRVQLALSDVNAGVSPSALENSVIERIRKQGKSTVVFTDWSEPSPVAQIPLAGGSVKTVSAKPAAERTANSEPEVTMLVQAFDVDEAGKPIQAAKEKQLRRGAVANMVEDAEVIVENGRFIDEIDSFKFHTDIAVLDIQGGQKLSRNLAAPARVLLMDSAGQLYVQDELEDFPDVDEHNVLFSEEETPGGRGFPRGRGEFDRY